MAKATSQNDEMTMLYRRECANDAIVVSVASAKFQLCFLRINDGNVQNSKIAG